MENQPLVSVIIPVYNTEKYLHQCLDSVLAQTMDSLEIICVDDGSTDNKRSLIEGFISENAIEIEYIYRENGGKMRAHNDGVRNSRTPYFLCLDSDDYLVDDAVEKLIYSAEKAKKEVINFAGVIAHKGRSESELLSGVNFPEGIQNTSLYNLYLNGFKGETTILFVTDVIAAFPFPEIEGEKYVPEDYIYDKIDEKYEYIVLDEIITVCEIVSEGYTDSVVKLKKSNPVAFYMYYEQRAIITPLSLLKIKYSGFYVKYAKICKRPIFNTKLSKIYVLIGTLASVFINE